MLAHIRDNLPTVGVSYIDAIFNLADIGTKLKAPKEIWQKFMQSGEFNISFLGRKLSREVRMRIGREENWKEVENKPETRVRRWNREERSAQSNK